MLVARAHAGVGLYELILAKTLQMRKTLTHACRVCDGADTSYKHRKLNALHWEMLVLVKPTILLYYYCICKQKPVNKFARMWHA